MNKIDIIVVDLETGGLDHNVHEVIEIGAKAYNHQTLEPYKVEDGGEFTSLVQPKDFSALTSQAMKINKIPIEKLKEAPPIEIVYPQFVQWVNKWNRGNTEKTAPIVAGKNIRKFDFLFLEKIGSKFSKKATFNRISIDLEDIIFLWFENEAEPTATNMDALRKFFGIQGEDAHRALPDCREEGDLIMRFLKLHRNLQKHKTTKGEKLIKFKGAFGGQ